jgi:hypothetical protein
MVSFRARSFTPGSGQIASNAVRTFTRDDGAIRQRSRATTNKNKGIDSQKE